MLDAESIVAHDERDAAFARYCHELNTAIDAMRRAYAINQAHWLGLEPPTERPLMDAIHACAKAREKEKT